MVKDYVMDDKAGREGVEKKDENKHVIRNETLVGGGKD